MTDVAVTPTELVRGVVSADILDAGGTSIGTASTDVFVITPTAGFSSDAILLKFLVDSSGDTITIVAGDNPPAHLQGLATFTITMAASDVRYIVVESARFNQDNGTIRVTCTDDGTTCKAFAIPGLGGGGPMNP